MSNYRRKTSYIRWYNTIASMMIVYGIDFVAITRYELSEWTFCKSGMPEVLGFHLRVEMTGVA